MSSSSLFTHGDSGDGYAQWKFHELPGVETAFRAGNFAFLLLPHFRYQPSSTRAVENSAKFPTVNRLSRFRCCIGEQDFNSRHQVPEVFDLIPGLHVNILENCTYHRESCQLIFKASCFATNSLTESHPQSYQKFGSPSMILCFHVCDMQRLEVLWHILVLQGREACTSWKLDHGRYDIVAHDEHGFLSSDNREKP